MHSAEIWSNGRFVGESNFSEQEKNHFSYAPTVAAKCALSSEEINSMGIDDNDTITICFNGAN